MENRLKSSARELRSVKSLVTCAALIALYIVVDSVSFFPDPTQKYTVSFLALALLGYRFGIVPSSVAAIACDIIGYVIKPMGAYHPGFAISKVLTCVVFALFLYRREIKIWRIIASKAIVNIFINIALNTFWISTLYGKAFMAILANHVPKNLILLPVEIVLLWLVLKAFERFSAKVGRR